MKKTILYEKHLMEKAEMTEFGGWLMPLVYHREEVNGITEEHLAVRDDVGLFDVSHMGKIMVSGTDTAAFLDYLLTASFSDASFLRMIYSVMLSPDAGIIDDLMVYKYNNEKALLVVNAGNTEKDLLWLKKHKGDFKIVIDDITALCGQLALQGPNSERVLQRHSLFPLSKMKLFDFREIHVNGAQMIVSRSGYTGSDGFEIYGKAADIATLFTVLSEKENVRLCGLGCRDTLRFEAAMPLYGHEIDADINPIEAGLGFCCRFDHDFIGRDSLLRVKNHPTVKSVGLELTGRGIARSGYSILALESGEKIGYVTTGYLLPRRKTALALGFVATAYSEIGTKVGIVIRRNVCPAEVRDRKFMDKKYHRQEEKHE